MDKRTLHNLTFQAGPFCLQEASGALLTLVMNPDPGPYERAFTHKLLQPIRNACRPGGSLFDAYVEFLQKETGSGSSRLEILEMKFRELRRQCNPWSAFAFFILEFEEEPLDRRATYAIDHIMDPGGP